MSKNKNAQTSVEFVLLLAVAILVITVIIIIATGQVGDISRLKDQSDMQNAISDLSSAAKEVYAQGEGSKKLVFIQLPTSYESNYSSVGNKTIRMRAAGTDYVTLEKFNVHGYLPGIAGRHWVWVVSEGNRVRIGDAMLELDKNRVYVIMNSNTTTSTSFSVKNIWVRNITVSTATTWTTPDVTMSGVPAAFSLDINYSTTINLQFTSSPASGGVYTGEIEFVAIDDIGNNETVDVPVTVEVIPAGQALPTVDIQGPLITSIYQDPTPALKLQPLAIFVNASDILTGNSTISSCQIDSDSANNWTTMLPVDGAYDQTVELSIYNYTNGFVLGPHTIQTKCTDVANNTGPTAYYYFNVSEADQLGPIVIQMNHTEYPTTLSNISVSGVATDAYTGNSNIQICNVKIDSGSWNAASPDDGAWNSPTENFSYNVGPLAVGYHNVYFQCIDSLGNVGGIYNDSIGIVDVDLIIVLDRSGSMSENVTNVKSNGVVSAASSGWSWVKNLTVIQKNGDYANLTVEFRASTGGCLASYNATINGVQVATGNTTSTSYVNQTTTINITNYEPTYQIALWVKRNASGCTVYNRALSLQQVPTKMNAGKSAAKSFIDIAGNNIQAGLVSFSTSSTLDKTLALMGAANQTALKNAIDVLNPSGNTCIECGLTKAADELTSVRARPNATKVIVLLTDGISNVGNSVTGAVYCRDRNVTVYTIGFGYDVDDTELTNIALLTHGDYYFAPNVETLNAIFQSIGKPS